MRNSTPTSVFVPCDSSTALPGLFEGGVAWQTKHTHHSTQPLLLLYRTTRARIAQCIHLTVRGAHSRSVEGSQESEIAHFESYWSAMGLRLELFPWCRCRKWGEGESGIGGHWKPRWEARDSKMHCEFSWRAKLENNCIPPRIRYRQGNSSSACA